MHSTLEDLKLTQSEVETLSGLEISSLFVGGMVGGTYRPSIWKSTSKILAFGFTEIAVLLVLLIFMVPIGLVTVRGSTQAIRDPSIITWFGLTISGLAIGFWLVWNLCLWLRQSSLSALCHLVDEVDQYQEVLQAVEVIDQLANVQSSAIKLENRADIFTALSLTRETLVCALMTERILRKNQGILARRHELLLQIETRLTSLKALEITDQAYEYGQLLNEALVIGSNVAQTVRNFNFNQSPLDKE